MPVQTPKAEAAKSILWPAELNLLFQLGHWETSDEILSEALEALLERHPTLRQAVAVELFRQDLVSLSRAAEIAGADRWSFMETLRSNGIQVVIEPDSPEEMDRRVQAFEAARRP